MHDLLAYFAVTAALPPWDPTSSSMLHSRLHATGTAPDPSLGFYKEATIEVDVDHFGFEPLPPFRLRYFYNDTFWDRKSAGPIFLYTGNEAPITEFIKNTGALLEYAPTFKALVVFVEHRYYGDSWINGSWPFGEQSFSPDHLRYLTVEQALADFAQVALALRGRFDAPKEAAVVTFGGSYGANLAMWSRLKNPNIFAGAIASSVSVQKSVIRSTNEFWRIATEVYANVSTKCPTLIRRAWDVLSEKGETAKGREEIKAELGLCSAPSSQGAAIGLGGWYQGALETMVQYGYPYPTSFYNPVPGYPFRVACHGMIKAGTPLGALRSAADVYYNYSGQAGECFGFGSDDADDDIKAASGPPSGWGYQTCTEVYQPTPTNGLYPAPGGDMLLPSVPNKTAIFDQCKARYGVAPRPDWEENHLWGPNIGTGSNVFLSAGQLDPWRSGGIGQPPTAAGSCPAAGTEGDNAYPSIEFHLNLDGAHHLDLRASNPLDPHSVKECREKQQAAIRRWITEWAAHPPLPVTAL